MVIHEIRWEMGFASNRIRKELESLAQHKIRSMTRNLGLSIDGSTITYRSCERERYLRKETSSKNKSVYVIYVLFTSSL
jgi:hypothetical protein